MKPDEAAYRATVAALDVAVDEAVFIDDTWENVEAAARCGLRAIHFTDGPTLESELSAIIPLPEGGVDFANRPDTP